MQMLVESFQCAFATDGVAEEDGEKVDHLVVSEATASKAHLRVDSVEDALLAKIGDDQRDLLEYIIMPLFLIVWHVEAIREAVFHLPRSKRSSRACFWPDARL